MSDPWAAPPAADEVEVSVFGPGVGESIAVHLGDGEWLVVDSCVEGRTDEHPTLRYLQSIGVELGTQIELVVATHAHDDHVAGIARIVEAASSADVVVPEAATTAEFFALLSLDEENELLGALPSAYAEYRRMNDLLEERAKGRGSYPAYAWAVADRLLWQRNTVSGVTRRVTALSPSNEAVTRSKAWLGAQLVPGAVRKRTTPDDPNTFGVVLHVVVGDAVMLFGADLMTGPGSRCGWNAIVTSATRPAERASLYKVAHHGSARSEHMGIWSELLASDPDAVVTPYRPSRLPRTTDVERIRKQARSAWTTATSTDPAAPARVRRAAAELAGVAVNVRELAAFSGQVRARRRIGDGSWRFAVRRPAAAL